MTWRRVRQRDIRETAERWFATVRAARHTMVRPVTLVGSPRPSAGMKRADWFGRPDMTQARTPRRRLSASMTPPVDETGEEASPAAAREPG
jgi:hypothetical protein